MEITQQIHLLAQGAAAGIAAGVVISQDAGQGKGELCEACRDPALPVAQVANHQEGVRPQLRKEILIEAVPLTMEISGDGDAELGQAVPRLPPSCNR